MTPRASASYLYQWTDSYDESGAGAGNTSVASHDMGSLRLRAEVIASQRLKAASVIYVPHVKAGIAEDIEGGGTISGYFSDSLTDFDLSLPKAKRFRALAGLGIEIAFPNGSTAYLSYEGEAGKDSTAHALMGGVRVQW